jgi:hypothetical protein
MLGAMRRRRLPLVTALASLMFVGLVVCPCASMIVPAAAADAGHECCATGPGLRPLTPSCCSAQDSSRPETLVPPPGPGLAATSAPLLVPAAADVSPPVADTVTRPLAVPLVLRI